MKGYRILLTVGLVLASVVVVGGGAQAAERPNDQAGMIGVGAAQVVAPPDAFERAVLRSTSTPAPDAFERAVLRHATVAVRPDDRAGVRGPGAGATLVPVSVTPTEDGFGRNEALLGAGMLAVVLLGAAAALTIRQRRRVILR